MKTGFIDWTESSLNLFVFEKKDGESRLIDSSSYQLKDELDLQTLNSLPSEGCENIFLSIPLDLMTLREQNYPFTDRDKIRETIPFELEGILLGNIGDYQIDHTIIDSSDMKTRVLAACLEKSKLTKIINLFSAAGLEPKIITSLDLRLSEGMIDVLLAGILSDLDIRSKAAGDEIQNPTINFRRDELSYTGDVDKFIRNLRKTVMLVLIFLVLLGAGSVLKLTALKNEHTMLTGEIHAIYRRVFPEDRKIIDADRQFKGNMKKLLEKRAALGGVPVLDILHDIAELNRKEITLHEFSADGKNLVIKGTAKSFEDVESLKNELSTDFRNVKVTDSGATADNKINFTVVMQEERA